MQTTASFWNKRAESYAKSPIADLSAYEYTLERSRSYLRDSDHVLELGCGTGSTALLLAPSVRKITASDYADGMTAIGARKAREQGVDNVEFVTADLHSPALDGRGYDVVMAMNLLHLVKDLPAALARINDLLKPGDIFISKTICMGPDKVPVKFKVIKAILPVMQLFGIAPPVEFRTIRAFEGAITAHGFKIIETGNYPANPPSRFVVARKL